MLDPFTFAAAIAMAVASLLSPAPAPAPAPVTHEVVIGEAPFVPAPCQEDDPCWDCETMGNGVCGPVLTLVPNSGGTMFDQNGALYVLTLEGAEPTGECVFASPCDYAQN